MIHTTVNDKPKPALRPAFQAKPTARIWQCDSCGLKLFLAQRSEYPGIRCLCGCSCWKACPETEK